MTSTFQNIQFTVKPELFVTYYDISVTALSWTSMINMAVFIPLLLPAMVLFENTGLRMILLIGSGMNAVGTIIKCFAYSPDMFLVGYDF